MDFDNFYILCYTSFKSGPILDFLGSVESWDPEDFKSGPKKAREGHMKAVQLVDFWPFFK